MKILTHPEWGLSFYDLLHLKGTVIHSSVLVPTVKKFRLMPSNRQHLLAMLTPATRLLLDRESQTVGLELMDESRLHTERFVRQD